MSLRRTITSKVQDLLKKQPARGEVEQAVDTAAMYCKKDRPTRSFEDFFKHLKALGFSPEMCIDVGAAIGTKTIYQAFRTSKHIVFEPLPDFQAKLRKTLEPYDHVLHECVLSDQPGEVTLLRHNDLFGSSIMHGHDDQDERVISVQSSTLDIELKSVSSEGPFLLKTDCQGSDLMVLKGGIETLRRCEVVIVEASLFRFWGQHQPDFYDIVSFMKSHDFVLYDILDGLFRPRDSALGQIDLAFVKEHGMFREQHYW
ncbi:MAG: FkbM family methyltransferase [Pseudomonadota bacterium]